MRQSEKVQTLPSGGLTLWEALDQYPQNIAMAIRTRPAADNRNAFTLCDKRDDWLLTN